MKLELSKKHQKNYRVKITDHIGNTVMANNVSEAAEILGLCEHTIYQSLSEGKKARGCTLQKIFKNDEV